MQKISVTLLVTAVITAAAQDASANVLAYESFSYAVGPLAGQNGGTGFTTAWFPQTAYYGGGSTDGANVFATSLTYPGLTTSGGSMESRNSYESAGRSLPVGSLTTGIYYMSFLIAKGPNASGQDGNNPGAPDYGGLSFYGGNAGPENYFFGYGGAPAQGEQNLASLPSYTSDATFLVYKLNLDTDQFSVFVNPTVGASEPTPSLTWTSTADLGSIGINSDPGILFEVVS